MKNVFKMKNLNLFIACIFAALVLSGCTRHQNKVEVMSDSIASASKDGKVIILTVDGGGVKGIVPAIFLDSIEARTKKQSFELFDIIGGTSTGGIIALGLTTLNPANASNLPYTAQELFQIYNSDGDKLFVAQNCKVEHCAKYFASHNGQGIEPYLQEKFNPRRTLKEASLILSKIEKNKTKQVFTTTYIVNSTGEVVSKPVKEEDYGPYLFNWFDAVNDPQDDYYVWEAARGTSAAPTYFPIGHVGGGSNRSVQEKWVIDGGMMSNDPVVWAVSEAFRIGLATSISDIIVISLGTGFYPGDAGVGINNNHTTFDDIPKDGNWNYYPWVISKMYNLEGHENQGGTILNIVLDAVQVASDRQLQTLQRSGLTYFRLEPELSATQSQMDNISAANVNSLIDAAQKYLAASEGRSILDSIVVALKNN